MKRLILTFTLGFCIVFRLFAQTEADGIAIRNIAWTTKNVYNGIVLKTCEAVSFFNSKQSIAFIEIDTLTAKVDFKIDYTKTEFQPASVIGRRNHAIAAINGTYFNVNTGVSWHFMKIAGQNVASTVTNEFSTRATGVFTVTNGVVDISNWNKEKESTSAGDAEYALVCGPLLMKDNVDAELWDGETLFSTTRHPRSCVAKTTNGKVLIIAVDGRQSTRAAGMSLQELRYFVRQLGCVDALNLDGGGSTALYIAGETKNGIVNTPIDEDIRGKERNVGNILYITPKDGSIPYCFSGKAPGGVPDMRVWLKSDGEATADVFDYTGWNDFDYQKSTPEAKIEWNDNRINSYPALAFDSASVLVGKRKADYSTFYSVNTLNNRGTLLGFDETGSTHPKFRYFLMASNNVYVHDGSNTTGGDNYAFIPYQDSFNQNFNLYNSSFGKKYDSFVLNGKEQLTANSNFCTRESITAFLHVGARNSYPVTIPAKEEYFYRGEVAEVIAYVDTLTEQEHVRVESYLAVKYGITIANPEYRYTASYGSRWWDGHNANYTPYSNYITFIGRDDNSGLLQTKSKSVGNHLLPKTGSLLTLTHGSNTIDDDQYFVCVGASTDNLSSTTDLTSGNKTYRVLSRNWKFNTSESLSQPFRVEIDLPAALTFNENQAGIVVKNGEDYTWYQGVLNGEKTQISVDNVTVKKATQMYLVLDKSTVGINNPSPGFIHTVSVYSLSGILLYRTTTTDSSAVINASNLAKGVYLVVSQNGNQEIIGREKVVIN